MSAYAGLTEAQRRAEIVKMYASAVRDVWARGGARPTLPYDPAHSRNKGTPMLDTIALGGRGG